MKGLRWLGLLMVTVVLVAGCENNTATPTPTPPPAPAPAPTPTPPPAPAEPAALESLEVTPASVEGQASPTGTITLTANAPTGGAVVKLDSLNSDIAKVPSNVTVPAGQRTATFTVDTATVPVDTPVTLQANYLSVAKNFVMTVRSPALVPQFTVSSPSKGDNACSIVDSSGAIDCVFNGTASTGFVSNWIWTIRVQNTETVFSGGGTFTPATVCANLANAGSLDSNGTFTLSVSLVVEDRAGKKSSNNAQRNVAISPNGRCGY
jgi:hypothetical protein